MKILEGVHLRYAAILMVVFSLTGCYGMAHYETPPPQVGELGSGGQPVKPDTFEVKSKDFPRYTVIENIKPPGLTLRSYMNPVVKFADIEKTDIWKVTHKIGDRFIIQSDEFNDRQCRFMVKTHGSYFLGASVHFLFNTCTRSYDFGVYINANGEIDGGWEMLPGSRTLGSNRYMYMRWHPEKNEGWPKGPIFTQLK